MDRVSSTPSSTDRVVVVILAAGLSSRMGRPKQLLLHKNKTLLRHVVDAAAMSSVDDVLIILGHRAAEVLTAISPLPSRVRVVVNTDYMQGQATSLLCGLQQCDPSVGAAIVLLGDQPHVRATVIDESIRRWRQGAGPVIRSSYRGVGGHPVLLGRDVWELLDLKGDEGARRLIAERPDLVTDLQIDEDLPIDVDTPEDAQALGARDE